MASSGGESATAYINHHLTDWCLGCSAQTHQVSGLLDFSAFTLDLLVIGFLCAVGLVIGGWFLKRSLRVDNPGRWQVTFEFGVEYINEQIDEVFEGANAYVGAMALTIFCWVLLMNLMDLIPVDVFPLIAEGVGGGLIGVHPVFFRDVPTAALDTPFAMALVVFAIMVGYQVKANGPGGYLKRFLFHPYGKYGLPMNIITTLIDDISKPVSLALRLFGNMFAGELVFALLAMLSIAGIEVGGGGLFIWPFLHFVGGIIWSLFDMLIGVLQAFIFAILAIVYLGMAQQSVAH